MIFDQSVKIAPVIILSYRVYGYVVTISTYVYVCVYVCVYGH